MCAYFSSSITYLGLATLFAALVSGQERYADFRQAAINRVVSEFSGAVPEWVNTKTCDTYWRDFYICQHWVMTSGAPIIGQNRIPPKLFTGISTEIVSEAVSAREGTVVVRVKARCQATSPFRQLQSQVNCEPDTSLDIRTHVKLVAEGFVTKTWRVVNLTEDPASIQARQETLRAKEQASHNAAQVAARKHMTDRMWDHIQIHRDCNLGPYISNGADVNSFGPYSYGRHVLNSVIVTGLSGGDLPCVSLLLKAGADPNLKEQRPEGRTALHWAAHQGDLEIVQALLAAGGDISITDSKGMNALDIALAELADARAKMQRQPSPNLQKQINDYNQLIPLLRSRTAALNPLGPAQGAARPSTITDVIANRPCHMESSFKSQGNTSPAAVQFRNQRPVPVKLYWLNYEGKRVLYATLAPGQMYRQDTYVDHPWVATDEAGKCVTLLLPKGSLGAIEIR